MSKAISDHIPAYAELLRLRSDTETTVSIATGDAVYAGDYPLEETAAAAIASVATAVCDIWQLKTGRLQRATVDLRSAAAALESYQYLQRRDKRGQYTAFPTSAAASVAYKLTQPFRTRDHRWFLPHFGMLHLKSKMQQLLECEGTVESVAAAVAGWDADELENAVAERGVCGGTVRSVDEWSRHAQGQSLSGLPVIEIEKIADSAPQPFSACGPPLHGIRILDLTRILAGPVAARTCAEHGADVLMVAARDTPQIKNFVIDLSHGKRSTFLDLNSRDDSDQLKALLRNCDVFSQGYRPGVFSRRGFGPQDVAKLRPGIVYLSTSCFGQRGPWSERAGWEQVAQAVSGICHRVNSVEPVLLPVNVCDYLTGYLGAYGILLALLRRAIEGGSYHVNVSLCRSAMFLNRQPMRASGITTRELSKTEITSLQTESHTTYGALRHLAPVANYSESEAKWLLPSAALGADQPRWADQ